MKKHICKNSACGKTFEYCRGCLLSPIPYKDAGYCSKACQEADKIEEVIPVEDVEIVVNEEDISTSEEDVVVSSFFSATEVEAKSLEATSSVQPHPYYKKKKKNKYKHNKENKTNEN